MTIKNYFMNTVRTLTAVAMLAGAIGCSKQEEPKEPPALTHFDGNIEKRFYDSDKDMKTVERYQEFLSSDYGTGVGHKLIADVDRDSMLPWQKHEIDSLYRKLLLNKQENQ